MQRMLKTNVYNAISFGGTDTAAGLIVYIISCK
jgi:hypothetical protein